MDRSSFGTWGIELDRGGFARALAAHGVLVASTTETLSPSTVFSTREHAYAVLLDVASASAGVAAGSPLPWALPQDARRAVGSPDAATLAEAWSLSRAGRPVFTSGYAPPGWHPFPRLQIRREPWLAATNPSWLVELLSDPAVDAASVYIQSELPGSRREPPSWHWPLRVGFADDAVRSALRHPTYGTGGWVGAHVELTDLRLACGSCDLFVSTLDLRATLTRLLALPINASFILLLQQQSDPWELAEPLVRALQAYTAAGGIGFVTVDPAHLAWWFQVLIRELSHDMGLDVALHTSLKTVQAASPFLVADEALLAASRLSNVARRVIAQLDADGLETTALRELTFTAESDGASDIARQVDHLDDRLEHVHEARFIQVQAHEIPLSSWSLSSRAFRSHATYAIHVRIGPDDPAFLAATNVPFPDAELPSDETLHRLSAVFTDLRPMFGDQVVADPQRAEILLPARGASSSCQFFLRTGPAGERIDARIIVLHRNRVLQTARLRGWVLDDPSSAAADTSIEMVTEVVVRARTDDLESRRQFDAAVIVNHTLAGAPRLTAIVGDRIDVTGRAMESSVSGLQWILEQAVRRAVGQDVNEPATLDSENTASLLTALANHGSLLYRHLVSDHGMGGLAKAGRLQIVSAAPDAYLPVEFVYERDVPKDGALVCRNARDALLAGSCLATCPLGPDPHARVPQSQVVCPLGFWGLTKVIERHAHTPDNVHNVPRDYQLRSEKSTRRKRIDNLASAIFASSVRVDNVVPGSSDDAYEGIKAAVRGRAFRVTTWDQWADDVGAHGPTLLVLLPHTIKHPALGLPALEVGAGEQLPSSQVQARHVRATDQAWPIVLLIGCETSNPEIPFQEFPAAFRNAGAGIVVATLTRVLGREAAPVTKRLIRALIQKSNEREATFGDVMVDLRRTLLAEGQTIGFALVAYGDADWVIGAVEN